MNSEGNTNEISEEFEFRLTSLLNAWDSVNENLESSLSADDKHKKIVVCYDELELAKINLSTLSHEVDLMMKYVEGLSSN